MRRRALRIVGGLAVLAAGALALVVLLKGRTIPQNVALIRPGMTLAEVEGVFGRPPDEDVPLGETERRSWFGDSKLADVIFDDAGRVVTAETLETEPVREVESLLDRLHCWLRL